MKVSYSGRRVLTNKPERTAMHSLLRKPTQRFLERSNLLCMTELRLVGYAIIAHFKTSNKY